MYLQVTNNAEERFNQIMSTKKHLFKDVKKQGWNIKDCSVKEVPAAQVENVYKSADGKTVPQSRKS